MRSREIKANASTLTYTRKYTYIYLQKKNRVVHARIKFYDNERNYELIWLTRYQAIANIN